MRQPPTRKRKKPRLGDDDSISVKEKSLRTEARLADEIGFVTTPGSGNQHWPSGKGDGKHPVFMFEIKETDKGSISIGSRDIGKLYREASNVGKEPAIILTARGIPDPIPKDWVCVPSEVFTDMLRAYEAYVRM